MRFSLLNFCIVSPVLSVVVFSRCISHPLLHISVWRRVTRLLSGGSARPVHLWGRNHLLGETLPHFHWWDKWMDWESEGGRTRQVWCLVTHQAQAHFNRHKSYFMILPFPLPVTRGPSRQLRPINTAVTVMRFESDWLLRWLVKLIFTLTCFQHLLRLLSNSRRRGVLFRCVVVFDSACFCSVCEQDAGHSYTHTTCAFNSPSFVCFPPLSALECSD